MARVYTQKDCDISLIRSKKVAIIGYGAQGSAQAQNLRDSGVEVIIAELEGTENFELAKSHNFKIVSASVAAKEADVVQMLVQDHIQAELYKTDIEPNLSSGNALMFSHGFNIHFKQIVPPGDIDVFMVAPKGPGALVRTMFTEGGGVPCLIAVQQDSTGKAKDLALSYAAGIGGAKAGVIETSFAEETETDLFGEQVVLCGGVTSLIQAGFDTLVEAGYQPEIAYFECLHELKLITDLIYARGMMGMRKNVSDTAEYGDLTRGPRVINNSVKKEMKKILSEVKSGSFAKEWIDENKAGRPKFERLRKDASKHQLNELGERLRSLMSWIK